MNYVTVERDSEKGCIIEYNPTILIEDADKVKVASSGVEGVACYCHPSGYFSIISDKPFVSAESNNIRKGELIIVEKATEEEKRLLKEKAFNKILYYLSISYDILGAMANQEIVLSGGIKELSETLDCEKISETEIIYKREGYIFHLVSKPK